MFCIITKIVPDIPVKSLFDFNIKCQCFFSSRQGNLEQPICHPLAKVTQVPFVRRYLVAKTCSVLYRTTNKQNCLKILFHIFFSSRSIPEIFMEVVQNVVEKIKALLKCLAT